MVRTILIGPDLVFGQEILKALDAERFPVTVAMWMLQKEQSEDWELVISTPLYDQLGAAKAYDRLIKIMSGKCSSLVSEIPIRLESNRRPFIRALRKGYRTVPSDGMRLRTRYLGDTFIDDGYVYRVK